MRFRIGVKIRVIDWSNMRGQIGEIRGQARGKWLVYLEALKREVPFSEAEIEPVEQERK